MINQVNKELLELAANAAGIKGEYQHWKDSNDTVSCGIAPNGAVGSDWWNPLTNISAKYNLAKTLGMTIDFSKHTVWKQINKNSSIKEFWGEEKGVDEGHAILRLAAKIGSLKLTNEKNNEADWEDLDPDLWKYIINETKSMVPMDFVERLHAFNYVYHIGFNAYDITWGKLGSIKPISIKVKSIIP
ncbi:hypothetical protein GW796_07440 [archaeon]|nr:hypothetical protein [archaeon]NCQ51716.1 hypothetical protein [archaeon]